MRNAAFAFALGGLALLALSACSNPAGSDPDPEAGVVGDGTAADPYRIRVATDLDAIRGGGIGHEDWDPTDHYRLLADIDLAPYSAGEGWTPIGSAAVPFTGSLDGNGHSIRRLRIDRDADYQGLFGYISGEGTIRNLAIADIDVVSNGSSIGGLAGCLSGGTIEGCLVAGSVVGGADNVGGFVGYQSGGTIDDCGASVAVKGEERSVGGFVGAKSGGTINTSFATGSVSGTTYVGGFSGNDSGTNNNIWACYATGNASGTDSVGGFTGRSPDTVIECFSTGRVTGSTKVGGFLGDWNGLILLSVGPCFYDSETSGQSDSIIDIYAKSSAEMKVRETYSTWNFTSVWAIDPSYNSGYPYLRWERE